MMRRAGSFPPPFLFIHFCTRCHSVVSAMWGAGKEARSSSEIVPHRLFDGRKIGLRESAHRRSHKPPLVDRAELLAQGNRRCFSSGRGRYDRRRKGTWRRGHWYDADRPHLVEGGDRKDETPAGIALLFAADRRLQVNPID